MNILYCILHTKHQESRAKNILTTWGKDQNLLFYSDHEDPEIRCHKVTDQSDYASGQIKQINVFHLLVKQYSNYDWYFFCDNDTFVNTSKLKHFAETSDIDVVHGNIINCWPQDSSLYYPSGGAGYLVSNRILHQMTDVHYNNTEFSDVSIGLNFREKNIILKNNDLFKGQPPAYYNIKDEDVKNYITFHYISDALIMKHILSLTE